MNTTLTIAAISAALAFGSAWKIQDWRHDAAQLDVQRENANTADRASENREIDRAVIDSQFKTITVEVEKIVTHDVYHNVCIDADGLRELGRAIAATASESSPAVPAADQSD